MPLLNATVLGSLAGALHLYLRFLHNGQGEMYGDTGTADLPYAAILFFAAFVPVWLLTFGVGVTTRKILQSSIVDAAPRANRIKGRRFVLPPSNSRCGYSWVAVWALECL